MIGGRRRRSKVGIAALPVIFILISLSIMVSVAAASVLHATSNPPGSPASQNVVALNYWYVGALSNDSAYASNQGIRGEIQVVQQENVSSFLAFWVSDTLSNGLWGQVGYYIFHNSEPTAFYQVWNETTRSEIASGTAAVSFGNHLFSMYVTKGTTFEFSVDNTTIGYHDLGANASSAEEPMYALSEEGYCSAPFSFAPVSFSGLQVLKGGNWIDLASARSYGSSWGIAANGENQFIVGGSYSSIQEGTSLW
jgi:hypothetical protein